PHSFGGCFFLKKPPPPPPRPPTAFISLEDSMESINQKSTRKSPGIVKQTLLFALGFAILSILYELLNAEIFTVDRAPGITIRIIVASAIFGLLSAIFQRRRTSK
ncbi:hypothetical protein, partial [Massilia sp. AB1]|uniref:hypothetical protein n=1 Tax=Massilia sp. AB1 TaxID=2823371 RepID=UPI001B82F685